jgi:hypothetical protein
MAQPFCAGLAVSAGDDAGTDGSGFGEAEVERLRAKKCSTWNTFLSKEGTLRTLPGGQYARFRDNSLQRKSGGDGFVLSHPSAMKLRKDWLVGR